MTAETAKPEAAEPPKPQAAAEAPKPQAAEPPKPQKPQEKPQEKPAEEKQTNCPTCNKPIKKLKRYYRNGKFYCNKECWRKATLKAKEEKK